MLRMKSAQPFIVLLIAALASSCACAQTAAPGTPAHVSVYASVLATHLFVVGAANPQTGVFLQHPGDDTAWSHVGSKTIRAFHSAAGPGTNGRVLYIAGGNGVHLTRDGGRTWKITTGWQITEVMSVLPDPLDSNTVYCSTPYGIFKTTDGCSSWHEMNNGLSSFFTPWVIAGKGGVLYCVSEEGIYRSTDGAARWERMGLSVTGTRVVAMSPADPSFLIAGTEKFGLYVSHDGGKIWARSESGVDHMTFYAVAFDPVNPDIVYAGGYVTGVYKSLDGAKTWKRMNEGLANLNVHGIAVDPLDHNRVYAATLWGGVYASADGGATWKSAGLTGSQVSSIVINTY
jgi:photosystem II stability/assembly factor-like uncharacterized protein